MFTFYFGNVWIKTEIMGLFTFYIIIYSFQSISKEDALKILEKNKNNLAFV